MRRYIHSNRVQLHLYLISGTVLVPLVLFQLANRLFPLPVDKLRPPASTIVLDRNGEWLRVFIASDESWHIPEPSLDEISPKLRTAVLTYEDRWFYGHFGINPFSILQAAIDNIKAGKIVRGGSTITMQVARMMEPKPRTVPNKLVEMFRALQLELAYSKDEILTIYFNMAPYGGNIVGSAAASRVYFNKPQSRLSLGEAALLAAIPNSPTYLRPDVYPDNARVARKKVLRQMRKFGKIDLSEMQEAASDSIPTKRYPMPFKAPHLARLLAKTESSRGHLIFSTIDSEIQELSARVLREHLAPLRRADISTGAVVVMDTTSREVLAMVGSHDFFDYANEGQVNGAMAPRSPGSALKPFIFGLALERGLITPESLLHDVPVDYAGFSPVNYDGDYRGYVTAREALAHSLNVPAVNLYAQLGNDGIYTFLKRGGITTLSEPKPHYGLSLILGSCEVTLLELTSLYAGLANLGEFGRHRLIKSSGDTVPAPSAKRLLSRGASFILTEMLTEVRRPDLPTAYEASINLPKVAWKTGTSYGHRDAWSVGYTPSYTIGVWVGNFDGHGAPSLVGSEVAAPILFALFNALTNSAANRWYTRPYQVSTREVCALSGMLTSANCPTTKAGDYIANRSTNMPCRVHKQITIDNETGASLCSHCRIGRSYHHAVFEEWHPAVGTWLSKNGYAIQPIPPHNPDCVGVVAGQGPVIRSPSEDSEYHIRAGVNLEYQKLLLAASVSNRTKQIFWFVNGEMVFKGAPDVPVFLTPVAGSHQLTCVDDEGRSSSRTLVVRD